MSGAEDPRVGEALSWVRIGPEANDPIGAAVHAFANELRGLRESLPLLARTTKATEEELAAERFEEEQVAGGFEPDDERSRGSGHHSVDYRLRPEYLSAQVIGRLRQTRRDLGSAMLLMMVAHFDRFIGDMCTRERSSTAPE